MPVLTGRTGAPTGEASRGAALATTLPATASDGYRVALSPAETEVKAAP